MCAQAEDLQIVAERDIFVLGGNLRKHAVQAVRFIEAYDALALLAGKMVVMRRESVA